MKRATELRGPISGVANCVGSLLLKPAHLLSEAEWDATVATNLKSAFAVVRGAALRHGATGRIGKPPEIASAIEWLLDPEQSWVTGQVIGVDGGLSRVRSRS